MNQMRLIVFFYALFSLYVYSFFGDFFSFNFGGGGGQDSRNEVIKGDSFVIPLEVTLEEIYSGNFIEVCYYSIALLTKVVLHLLGSSKLYLGEGILLL